MAETGRSGERDMASGPTLRDAEQAAYNSGVIGQMKGEPYTQPQPERHDEDRRCAEAWRRGWRRSWEVGGAP